MARFPQRGLARRITRELDYRLEIYRPRNCTQPGLEPVTDQALRLLAELGVEGRVGGRDVRKGLEI